MSLGFQAGRFPLWFTRGGRGDCWPRTPADAAGLGLGFTRPDPPKRPTGSASHAPHAAMGLHNSVLMLQRTPRPGKPSPRAQQGGRNLGAAHQRGWVWRGVGGESYSHQPPWARDATPQPGCCLRRMRTSTEHMGFTAPSSVDPKTRLRGVSDWVRMRQTCERSRTGRKDCTGDFCWIPA